MGPDEPRGLDEQEAARRLARDGPNVPVLKTERPAWLEFLRKFRNPLVLTLAVAGALAGLLGDTPSFTIVTGVVLVSVTLDFLQEHRAGRVARALEHSMAPRARVVRSGRVREIAAAEVVRGDLVRLGAGDLVPADGRLVSGHDLFVDEASLTGEAYPAEKQLGEGEAGRVYAGTAVLSGTADVVVEHTGARTELGRAARAAVGEAPDAFEAETRRFGLLIMRVTVALVLFVAGVNTAAQRPVLEAFLFAVALAVGLTPELLPMIVSVTLARGALRLSRAHVVVRRLAAIHDLGAMDVLCTDKTGTLTEAKVRLERHVNLAGAESEEVLRLAWLNSHFETGLQNPMDEAILAHEPMDPGSWTKVDEVPFGFERRRVSVLLDDGARRWLVVKGAPGEVVSLCAHLSDDDEARIRELVTGFERDGFRVLAIASKEAPRSLEQAHVDDETGLVFAGIAAFLDPPKESTKGAVQALARDGVEMKVITGDGELVTRYVCERVGIPVRGLMRGAEVDGLDEDALARRAENVTVFSRTTPAQKARIVAALRKRHVVGYLGDGINDAPPLRTADVGISVAGAVEVAREAADVVLLENELEVLHRGVREGRRTFANVLKYLLMATSSNFGNMVSMAAASTILPFLPMRPVQVLLGNLLYDVSELPIPLDRVDAASLAHPGRWNLRMVERFMVVAGLISSAFDVVTFVLLRQVYGAGEAVFQSAWFVESMATQVLVILVLRTRERPWRSRPSLALLVGALSCVAVAAWLPQTAVGAWFGLVPPPSGWLWVVAGLTVSYLGCVEAVKRRFFPPA